MLRVIFSTLLIVCSLFPARCDDAPAADWSALIIARQADPNSSHVTKQLEDVVSAGMPPILKDTWLPLLPVETTPLPYDLGTLIVPRDYLPTHAEEPQHGWTFPKVTYLYLPGKNNFRLFCSVHYPDPKDGPLAARIARLLSLSHQTLSQKTGLEAANGTAPFDVWLCRGGKSGGEQWKTNLYLYDIDAARSSIEWIREVTHEYSHLALPPIGGYDAPEYWANGYLGERLIVRWLTESPKPAEVEAVWGDFSGASNFHRLLIAPALALYKKIGPSPVWLARKDEAGMRYFIGQALTFDDEYGSRKLGEAFSRLPRFHEANARDFAAALAETLSARVYSSQ